MMSHADHATPDDVARVREALRDWMFGQALPFWAAHGFAAPQPGGARPAHEHLLLSGLPADPGYTRMRVQARQLHVFSIAAERGVDGAATLADGLYRFIRDHGRVGDGPWDGAWARRLKPAGQPHDPTADLYDMAFVLFGFAHHARVTGDPAPLREAERTLAFIRARMTHPAGGFVNALPIEPGWRLQNPHMHLLEASHALFEASGDQRWADLAAELAELFHTRFFDPETGTLAEYFTQELKRAGGIDGDSIEPGHQVEWIWLLDRQQALFGGRDVAPAIAALARITDGHGVGAETGLMRDEIARDGGQRRSTARLWPQTELLRAGCVLHRRAATRDEADRAAATIVRTAESLLSRYLVGRDSQALPPGTWIDQLDQFGRPMVQTIPTSTLYHIMSAWLELDGVRPAAVPPPRVAG